MSRRHAVNNLNKESSRAVRPPNEAARLNGSAGGAAQRHLHDVVPQAASRMSIAGALLDYSFMLFLVIGGCCSYVSTLSAAYRDSCLHFMAITEVMSGLTRNCFAQSLMSVCMSRPFTPTYAETFFCVPRLLTDSDPGPALTFSQMLFITAQQLPSFITWDKSRTPGYSWLWLPRLKPRQVPISQYLLQVTTFASGTLLNNIVFAFSVPPTLQIVFRSAGNCRGVLPPSLLFLLLLVYCIIVESARAESWIVMDRSGSIYAPRSLFHGQALHTQTNCTSPSPLLCPLQRDIATHADDHSPLLLSLKKKYLRPFSREDCGSNSLVRRHYRDPVSAPHRVADHDPPRLRNDNKLHKHNSRNPRRRHCRHIAVHPRHRDAPSVARMHRRSRRTTRAHL
jgi:hypothetical protein